MLSSLRCASTARPDASTRQSYRGQFNWNADRTGFQVDHNYVGEHFSPEVGFLRRTAFRRTYSQARFSPRPKHVKGVRKVVRIDAGVAVLADTFWQAKTGRDALNARQPSTLRTHEHVVGPDAQETL